MVVVDGGCVGALRGASPVLWSGVGIHSSSGGESDVDGFLSDVGIIYGTDGMGDLGFSIGGALKGAGRSLLGTVTSVGKKTLGAGIAAVGAAIAGGSGGGTSAPASVSQEPAPGAVGGGGLSTPVKIAIGAGVVVTVVAVVALVMKKRRSPAAARARR